MDDALAVDVLDAGADLDEEVPGLVLCQDLPPLHEGEEGLLGAQLEEDVDVLGVFEAVDESAKRKCCLSLCRDYNRSLRSFCI